MGTLRLTGRVLAVAAALAVIAPVGASAVQAGDGGVGSHVSLAYRARKQVFKGRVGTHGEFSSSDTDSCVANRKVELFKKRKRKDRSFGWIRTNGNGVFAGKIKGGAPDGTYYVVARPKSFTDSYGDLVLCKRARSNDVKV